LGDTLVGRASVWFTRRHLPHSIQPGFCRSIGMHTKCTLAAPPARTNGPHRAPRDVAWDGRYPTRRIRYAVPHHHKIVCPAAAPIPDILWFRLDWITKSHDGPYLDLFVHSLQRKGSTARI